MNSIPILQSSKPFLHTFPVPESPTSSSPQDITGNRKTSRDWDETMRDLMRGLEQICGPKGGDPNRRYSKPEVSLSPAVSTPPTPPNFAQEIHRAKRDLPNDTGNRFRHHSDQPLPRYRGQRMIFVRHIETHQELNNKLFEICRHGSLTEAKRPRTSGEIWRAAQFATKTSLHSKSDRSAEETRDDSLRRVRKDKRRVRFQLGEDERDICLQEELDQRDIHLEAEKDQRDACLHAREDQRHIRLHAETAQKDASLHADKDHNDNTLPAETDQGDERLQMEDQTEQPIQVEIGGRNVEDLVVAVRDQRHLTVEAISRFGDNILYDSLLSDDLISGPLLCHLTGNGLLYIRRLPPSMAREEFVGTGCTFIPVIRRNEASLELTVVLHIPDDFRFDDVIVRTVDSQLIVNGRKRLLSLPSPDGASSFGCYGSERASFTVSVQLPKEVNCRSVNASITEDHQLIVKGEIDPVPRRNSL